MNEPLKSRWTRIWRVINNWLLALDPDPWEPMHTRMRRLEEAVFAQKSAATPFPAVGPPTPDSPAPCLTAKKTAMSDLELKSARGLPVRK